MSEFLQTTLILVPQMLGGIVLGTLFFVGLWWTVRQSNTAKNPAVLMLGSLIVRMAIVLAGFYWLGANDWKRIMACFIGFFIARFVIIKLSAQWENQHAS
jgi:F1F0 ATPase subunit 2